MELNRDLVAVLVCLSVCVSGLSAQETPDIWNLPELKTEQGQYTADWDSLSRGYSVPAWWREAN